MPKKNLRRVMLAKRKALSSAEWMEKSLLVQQALIATEEYSRAQVLALYASIHKEVDLQAVLSNALGSGKKILLPAVVEKKLLFRELEDTSLLQEGAFGIMEPSPSNRKFIPDQADMIVLPGVAFDLRGNRLGYGKGFYDKALHHLEGMGKLAAVCYDFQLVEEIKSEPHDVKVDLIVTEKRVVRIGL